MDEILKLIKIYNYLENQWIFIQKLNKMGVKRNLETEHSFRLRENEIEQMKNIIQFKLDNLIKEYFQIKIKNF